MDREANMDDITSHAVSTSDSACLVEESKPQQELCKPTGHTHEQPRGKFRLTVEPVMFLAVTGFMIPNTLLTNLLLFRSCEYMKLENCSSINTHSGGALEKEVQPYVAQLSMCKLVLESVIPTLMAFFIGSWSDSYGRKPLMIAPLLGYCMQFISLIVFSMLDVPPMFVLLTSVPLVLMGGSMTFYTGSFSYINDVSPKKDLPSRLALLEGMLYLGILVGNTAGPYLYTVIPSFGYEAIFGIACALCACSLLYLMLLVPESITTTDVSFGKKLKALFDFQQVVVMFRVCFGHHDGYSRPIRLIMVGASLLSVLALEGTLAVSFLFCRNKFSWNIKDFTIYADVLVVLNISGVLIGTLVFSKWCKLPSAPLSCFGFLLKAAANAIAGLGNTGWYMYLSGAVGCLGQMSSPLSRAIIAETVPKRDIGKLFAITSAFMTAVPLIAGPTYTILYDNTISTFPGSVFLLSAALMVVCCVLLGLVVIIQKQWSLHQYMPADEDNDDPQHPPSTIE